MSRVERLSSLLRQEIGEIIQTKLKDPRVGFCTVTNVQVSGDLKIATVWVSVMGDEQRERDCLAGLERAAGFIKRQLGQNVKLKYVPELRFRTDKSTEFLFRIDELIKSIGDELHDESE